MVRHLWGALVSVAMLFAGCGVHRSPIVGTAAGGSSSGDGGSSGDAGTSGSTDAAVDAAGASGGTSGTAGSGGTGGTGGADAGAGSGGTSIDSGLDSAVTSDAGGTDAAVVAGSCRGFQAGGSPCPSQCTNACANGICEISCGGIGALGCAMGNIVCPPGWGCSVSCTGINSCSTRTVQCADGPCTVLCSGLNTCSSLTINCGNDACRAECAGAMAGVNLVPGTSCGTASTCQ